MCFVCIMSRYHVPTEAQRKLQIPWNWSMQLWGLRCRLASGRVDRLRQGGEDGAPDGRTAVKPLNG